jgi:polyhydroxyalkanoate synthesis regulator phasin
MKLAKATGQETIDLEIKKLQELEKSTKQQIAQLESLAVKKGELNEEEAKQYKDLQSQLLSLSSDRQAKEIENERAKQLQLQKLGDLEERLRVAGLSAREREIDAIKNKKNLY